MCRTFKILGVASIILLKVIHSFQRITPIRATPLHSILQLALHNLHGLSLSPTVHVQICIQFTRCALYIWFRQLLHFPILLWLLLLWQFLPYIHYLTVKLRIIDLVKAACQTRYDRQRSLMRQFAAIFAEYCLLFAFSIFHLLFLEFSHVSKFVLNIIFELVILLGCHIRGVSWICRSSSNFYCTTCIIMNYYILGRFIYFRALIEGIWTLNFLYCNVFVLFALQIGVVLLQDLIHSLTPILARLKLALSLWTHTERLFLWYRGLWKWTAHLNVHNIKFLPRSSWCFFCLLFLRHIWDTQSQRFQIGIILAIFPWF